MNPGEVFWTHYIDQKNTPLYPFGYGLSYTKFEYDTLLVSNTYSDNKQIEVIVDVTNIGKRQGVETVQLYLKDVYASVIRPLRSLKGLEQISLQPVETKKITFTLTDNELGFYDNQGNWLVEPGSFDVFVGTDSTTEIKSTFKI